MYIAPAESLRGLNRIALEPIEIWYAPDSKYRGVDPNELAIVVNSFQEILVARLEPKHSVVAGEGEGILGLRIAVTNVKAEKKKRGLLGYTPAGLVVGVVKDAATAGPNIDLKSALIEAGVSGSVRKAWLYWHLTDLERAALGFIGGNFDYDEPAIEFDRASIIGTRIAGLGNNNCWGNDANPNVETAALYRADVTAPAQARGNVDCAFSGLADGAGHSAYGMSLIVYFDDGNPDNEVRVRHFDGLTNNWNSTFKLFHQGVPVEAITHVGDGQGMAEVSIFAGNSTGNRSITPVHDAAF